MCRIMCYITKKGHKARDQIILHALKNSDSNGGHSVGLLSIDEKGRATTRKYILTGEETAAQLHGKLPKGRILLVHNRFATHGARDETNAHPISKEGAHVIHNGVLSNYASIPCARENVSQTDTESILDLYLTTGRDPIGFNEQVQKLIGSKNFIIYDEKKKVLIIYKDTTLDFSHSPSTGDAFIVSDYKSMIGKRNNRLALYTYHNHKTLFGNYETRTAIIDEDYEHDFIQLKAEHDYFVVDALKLKTIYSTKAPRATSMNDYAYNPFQNYSKTISQEVSLARIAEQRDLMDEEIAAMDYERTQTIGLTKEDIE